MASYRRGGGAFCLAAGGAREIRYWWRSLYSRALRVYRRALRTTGSTLSGFPDDEDDDEDEATELMVTELAWQAQAQRQAGKGG